MVESILIILLILAISTSVFFFSQLKSERIKTSDSRASSEQLIESVETYKTKSIQLEAEKNSLEKILDIERESAKNKQVELREQLELIGNEIVSKGSKSINTENETRLNQILSPLKEKLEKFERKIAENNEKDIKQFTNMETLIKTLSEQHSKVQDTAQNLVNALRGEQKTQGDWGEMALERILEFSGLENGREYHTQSSYRNEKGELLRPDVIIQLPDDKHIIIDAKVSLKAFEQYVNEDDFEKKKLALALHLTSIKAHIKGLGEKDYSHLPGVNSPDFVLLFMPVESAFALAIKEEPDLYQEAWKRKIVLVTPSTLLATLKTVEGLWKQERQNKNAFEIAEQAGRLYDKFVGFVSDLEKIGIKQNDANKAYEDAMSKLKDGKGNLTRSAEKLKELGVKSKKKLDQKFLDE
ncbi:MAG: DNA recombination protein RmuC [Flavobacteriales bacterium]|nr:DNA recombination protein RmuC [Flavobacteriales bacterium]